MRNPMNGAKLAGLVAAMVLASGSAFAMTGMSAGHVQLSQLTPALRAQVKARMSAGEGASGVLTTMLLNRIEPRFPISHLTSVNFATGQAVVQGVNGKTRTFHFDPATMMLKS